MKAEVAIVGNGVAGTACAMHLAREGIRPLMIGRGLPVDRPPLPKSALADGVPRLLSDSARLDERGVDRLDGSVLAVEVAVVGAGLIGTESAASLVGRDAAGKSVCAFVVDEPRRLREARALLQGGEA